jgi:radical SAM-linked protein
MARPMPSGPPPAPTVQRLTIRYSKRGRMRFASHRDVARAIERGVRKAGVPVAYSAGFSPHPRISYSGGAPTGSASEAEYLELAVTRRCEPDDVGRRLNAALPDGIDVIEVVEAGGRSAGVQLEASEWKVIWPGLPADAADCAVQAFLAAPSVQVQRLTSKGIRTLDARAAVISLTSRASEASQVDLTSLASPISQARTQQPGIDPPGIDPAAGCAILRMIVRQMTPAVRPDDILAALRQFSAPLPTSPPLVTRLWQGPMSALTADQTGAQTGMAEASAATGPVIGEPAERMPELRQHHQDSVPRPEVHLPPRTTDKAMQPEAESAQQAPAGRLRANEQPSCGTRDQLADRRAREPYGRDRPDARNRATESTVRI